MTIRRLLIGIVSMLAIVQLSGCTDHYLPGNEPSRLRVKSLMQVVPDYSTNNGATSLTYVSAFQYDTQGRLSTINAFKSPGNTPTEVNTYLYDAQNQLSEHKRTIVGSSDYELHRFSYSSGFLTGIAYSNTAGFGSLVPIFGSGFTYNNGVVATSDVRFLVSIGVSYRVDRVYGVTNSNITSLTSSVGLNKGGPPIPFTSVSTFTYDDKINPFYGIYVIPQPTGTIINVLQGSLTNPTFYGGIDNWLNLSRNNLLSSPGTSYTYTYNSANLPTSRTTINTANNNAVTETLYYEYESY